MKKIAHFHLGTSYPPLTPLGANMHHLCWLDSQEPEFIPSFLHARVRSATTTLRPYPLRLLSGHFPGQSRDADHP